MRSLSIAAAAIAAGALTLALGAAPATAHEGEAIITVEQTHPAGLSVHYFVRVTWENDGHPANGATVTATAVRPDGTTLTPVTLRPLDNDGRYEGAVEFPEPGNWTVRFTAIEPTGTLEQPQSVVQPTTTAAPPVTEGAAPAEPTDDANGSTGTESATSDGGDSAGVIILGVAAAVVVGGVGLALLLRRRRAPGLAHAAGGSPTTHPDETSSEGAGATAVEATSIAPGPTVDGTTGPGGRGEAS